MLHTHSHTHHPATGTRLLVVDANEYMRELYALVLNLEGHDVETACDCVTALELLAEESFDLLVTDHTLPDLDSAGMILAMRSAGITIPIVVVSDSLLRETLPPRVAAEIAAIVPKPARSAGILSAVAHALNGTPQGASRCREDHRPEPAAQQSARPVTPARHTSSSILGWSKVFTSVVLHIRPAAENNALTQ
ncbi:MAG: response regulator [Chthoniobacteraceae bacterium]